MRHLERYSGGEEEELRDHFAYLFPTVPFDSIPTAGLVSRLSLFLDMSLEDAALGAFKHASKNGHFYVERTNFRYQDDLHVYHHVEAVQPLALQPMIPDAVRRLIRVEVEEVIGKVGYEIVDGYELRIVGVAAKGHPIGLIWYNQGIVVTPDFDRLSIPIRTARA